MKGYLNLGTTKNYCVFIEHLEFSDFTDYVTKYVNQSEKKIRKLTTDGIIFEWNENSRFCTDRALEEDLVSKRWCKSVCYLDGDIEQAVRHQCSWIWSDEGEELIERKMRKYIKKIILVFEPNSDSDDEPNNFSYESGDDGVGNLN